MRAVAIIAGLLLIALSTASPVAAEPAQNTGPYVGLVTEGERDHHRFSTHGDNPCLSIYIPKLYVVTINHAPGDVLRLSANGESVLSKGAGTISFVANYCTSFGITVEGVDVDSKAAYAVTVESVFITDTTALKLS